MYISKLITKLEELKQLHGDYRIYVSNVDMRPHIWDIAFESEEPGCESDACFAIQLNPVGACFPREY